MTAYAASWLHGVIKCRLPQELKDFARSSTYCTFPLQVKLDDVDGLGRFVQILGRDRDRVAALGRELGLEGSYIPRSYIEQVG